MNGASEIHNPAPPLPKVPCNAAALSESCSEGAADETVGGALTVSPPHPALPRQLDCAITLASVSRSVRSSFLATCIARYADLHWRVSNHDA
jgi:hypothetical protein